MVATITFKFKSSNHVGVIDVPHRVMSCREVKEAIAEKLGGSPDEIDIFVSGTTDYLHPNEELPAYTVVEVVRHVGSGRPPPRREHESTGPVATHAATNAPSRGLQRGETADNESGLALTEEERLAQLNEAVAADTGINEVVTWKMRQARGRGAGFVDNFRPPPPGYICHNCGKKGHLIQHCPAAKGAKGLKLLSLPTGIPETMLVECTMDDPAAKFVTRDGRIVKRKLDNQSFVGVVTTADTEEMNEQPINGDSCDGTGDAEDGVGEAMTEKKSNSTRSQFLCAWDAVIARNAMKAPCCGVLFCESCFNKRVEEMIAQDDIAEMPLHCPNCKELLDVPEVQAATDERKTIELLLSRKRGRS
uniref:Uncharacterized protein TCIL3000_9_5220 n=1 Tax=Trypanosoma congolense (strain IL3000) TaxID=1068625 RepID=G0UUQ1_TRYCI|nr:unnamed protein product [Trypanosoma congolense IL3000]